MPDSDQSQDAQTGSARASILKQARLLIGTSYDKLDCSHMVWTAYKTAGYEFPYTSTSAYPAVLVGTYFVEITEAELKPGDLILYSGHVGIYDPDGCSIVNTAQCQGQKDASEMRVLSARSGKNLGTEYGRSSWFGTPKKYLKWKSF